MDEYKIRLHGSIFDLVHYGKFDYFAVYEMPVHLRSFYLGKLVNTKEKEKAQMDAATNKAENQSSGKLARGPAISKS